MGHESHPPGGITPEERTAQIKSVLIDTFANFLQNGGAIARNGTVITFNYYDINVASLSPKQSKELEKKRILSDRLSNLRSCLPLTNVHPRTTVHIVQQGTLSHLFYRRDAYRKVIIGIEGSVPGFTTDIRPDYSLVKALANYTDTVLEHEKLAKPGCITGNKLTHDILLQLAEEKGLEDMNSAHRKKQEALIF